ncbi:MAG TPA: glycosyltransferase family 39 protein [Candidatus Polarisedimenticolia bacterium]|nr:glycosyltransferase family 39 protein [Candidatus Polarisedimenticolia bacterium]
MTKPKPPAATAPAGGPGRPSPGDFIERRAGGLAAILLALLVLQGIAFIAESSQTSDEAAHLSAGYSYLTRHDFRLNPEHPPLIKELAALPLLPLGLDFPDDRLWQMAEEWNIGRLFVHENRLPNDTILFLGRLPVLALSVLLGWALYRVGRRLFGAAGGLLALALYVLDPNVVAASGLVTTDLGITLFIFLAAVALQAWLDGPTTRRLLLLGLATGGAFAAKYTALWLPPILAGLGLSVLLRDPGPSAAWQVPRPRRLLRLAVAAPVVIAVAALVLALSYGFTGLPWWLEGLNRTLHHSAIGHRAWLMGQISDTGWWYYFPLAFLWKTPPGTLLILLAAILAFAFGRRLPARDEWFLLVPCGIILVIVCAWKVNIGLRHLLPLYPFLFLFAGRLAWPGPAGAPAPVLAVPRRRRFEAVLLAAGLAWNGVEAVRITPEHLAYFNFLAGGPAGGHRYLLDSNCDWGQASKALKRYLDAQGVPMIYSAFTGNSDPWYYGVRYQYAPGSGNMRSSKDRPARMPDGAPRELLAINAMVLHSLHFSDHHLYDWLLDRTPIARPGWSWFVYDITKDADAHAMLAALCLSFGLLDLAEDQARRTLSFAPGHPMAEKVLQVVAERRASPEATPEPASPPRP